MAADGAQRVMEDSSDSDDSMSGKRPVFSSEETALPDDLLENSEEFVRLYEEHQPELQQVIKDLEGSSDEFLDKYGTATRASRAGGLVGAAGVVGGIGTAGAAILFAPFTGGLSLVLGAASVSAAVGGGAASFKSNTIKEIEQKKAVDEVENALNKFNTTTDRVTNRLKNICNDVEKIWQYQNDEQSRLIKHGIEHFRKSVEDLSDLAKLFAPGDLRRVLEQGTRTVHMHKFMQTFIAVLLNMLGFLFILEDNRTLRDFDKLKRRLPVREEELESKAGKFIYKMRETINHLQNTLNELETSKSEVERVIIPNLNQYVKQQREAHKSAESD
ncbi:uncharacterized protein LOC111196819 isoform X1 [Astyanax mexicanus]|uniref:uncharacterized protein LOC111196819 isoform X1 n=1 Tax=Astyanax mexicanus TaxID=7994 RepID=UPI0020CB4C52|nr:uncharacterized protein LOC111196819 isoform X1 [Astyanax mexicanus]XP_049331799.1 uncharacterized protein LOC111196819 isoform X1 [Astyanax mexicanus]